MLISVERAEDEPEMLAYSVFLLISAFTMVLSFRRSKEAREMRKRWTTCAQKRRRWGGTESDWQRGDKGRKSRRMQRCRKIRNPVSEQETIKFYCSPKTHKLRVFSHRCTCTLSPDKLREPDIQTWEIKSTGKKRLIGLLRALSLSLRPTGKFSRITMELKFLLSPAT